MAFISYRHVLLRVGRPIDLASYYSEDETKYVIDQIAAKVRRIVIKLYDGEDLDKFMTGETPFNFALDRV